MLALITLVPPYPDHTAYSYTSGRHPFNFAKIGLAVWCYQGTSQFDEGFAGPIHWLNQKKCIIEAEFPNPTGLKIWTAPNWSGNVRFALVEKTAMQSVVLNGKTVNPLTGKSMPLEASL